MKTVVQIDEESESMPLGKKIKDKYNKLDN